MNEPAPPPHGPRGRRPDDWSSADWPPAAADVSDTSVLPGPAFTAVFPPDAGDAAPFERTLRMSVSNSSL